MLFDTPSMTGMEGEDVELRGRREYLWRIGLDMHQ